jgi:hypothetical protein
LGERAEGPLIAGKIRLADASGDAGRAGGGRLREGLHDREQGRVLEEREFSCAEMVEKRTERLRSYGYLWMEVPSAVKIQV